MKRIVYFTVAAITLSCAAAKPPRSLNELKDLRTGKEAEVAQKCAPLQWEEAGRYLQLAETAMEKRHFDQAERFAELGLLETKAALASRDRYAVEQRIEKAAAKRRALIRDLERIKATVAKREEERERRRIRRHLVEVIEKSRLRAAADEEQQDRFLNAARASGQQRARFEVGIEMISHARVLRDWLKVFTQVNCLDEKRLQAVEGQLENAEQNLARGDLPGVQRAVEQGRIISQQIIDEIIGRRDNDWSSRIARLELRLRKAGFEVFREDLGVAVQFVLPRSPDIKDLFPKELDKKFSHLLTVAEEGDDVLFLILAAAGTKNRPQVALNKSRQLATSALDALLRAGTESTRAFARGCADTSPLSALREGEQRIAVSLLPAPRMPCRALELQE